MKAARQNSGEGCRSGCCLGSNLCLLIRLSFGIYLFYRLFGSSTFTQAHQMLKTSQQNWGINFSCFCCCLMAAIILIDLRSSCNQLSLFWMTSRSAMKSNMWTCSWWSDSKLPNENPLPMAKIMLSETRNWCWSNFFLASCVQIICILHHDFWEDFALTDFTSRAISLIAGD